MQRSKFGYVAVVALVAALAALNLYQYFARAAVLFEQRLMSDRQVIDRYHELFYKTDGAYWANRWLGISTLQNPNDVWITQEIITDVKPDFLVETGTYRGGSAALWAMVLAQVNPAGRVITIDIKDQVPPAAKELPIVREKVDFLIGSSTSPEIVEEVKRRTQGKRVLVLLDSNHAKDHVLEELRLYAPLVSVGSYVIVQDTNVNGHPIYPEGFSGPGPWEAVEAFLAENDQFEPDHSRERLLFTMHPRGYLNRVK
jgi:cephalosporin hydroxylase